MLVSGTLLGIHSVCWGAEQQAALKNPYEVTVFKEGVSSFSYSKTIEFPVGFEKYKGHINYDGTAFFSIGKDGKAYVWNVETGKSRLVDVANVETGAFSPDGKTLLLGTLKNGAYVVNASTGKTIRQVTTKNQVWAVAYSADGEKMATSGFSQVFIWYTASGNLLLNIQKNPDWIKALALSSNGDKVVTGSHYGHTVIYDTQKNEKLRQLPNATRLVNGVLFESSIRSLAISEDDRVLLVKSDDYVRLFDLQTGDLLLKKEKESKTGGWVAALSPDGKTFLIGSTDGTTTLYDAGSGDELLVLEGNGEPLYSVGFSSDGSTIFTQTPHTITIWNT